MGRHNTGRVHGVRPHSLILRYMLLISAVKSDSSPGGVQAPGCQMNATKAVSDDHSYAQTRMLRSKCKIDLGTCRSVFQSCQAAGSGFVRPWHHFFENDHSCDMPGAHS